MSDENSHRRSSIDRLKNALLLLCLLAPSVWMIVTIPPLWRDVDAYLQLTEDPRVATFWGHAPAYCYVAKVPLFVANQFRHSSEVVAGLTDRGVQLLIVTQHLGLAAAVFYFIRAVSSVFWVRLVLVLAWASNPLSYTYAHCVGSESLSMILVVVLALKALRLIRSQGDPPWIDWYVFAIVLCVCILSRHLNLCLLVLVPATFFLLWVKSRFRGLQLSRQYFHQTMIALLIGIACLAVAGSLTRGLARKTKLHPHSRLGYTFVWRLRFLNELPPDQRSDLLQQVTARTKRPETRKLISLVEQIEQEGSELNAGTLMQRATRLLYSGKKDIPWEELDEALNDMAFAFLLPPTAAHIDAAKKDFVDALAAPVIDPAFFLFPSTSYYFLHRDQMPGCAGLVTFRDTNAAQIDLIPTQHAYFNLWKELPFYGLLTVWVIALLALLIVARRKNEDVSATMAFAVALAGLGLLIVAVTCLLDEYSPRFGLPMSELLLLALMLLAGNTADLLCNTRQKSAGQLFRPEP
jgi:hypothetical protein